jgi:predicted membrane protein
MSILRKSTMKNSNYKWDKRKILSMLGLYALICILEFSLLSLFIHIRLFSGVLYFFRLFIYATLAGVLLLAGFIALCRFNVELIISGVIISILMVFFFVSIFLAVVDRSYSVFSLNYLEKHRENSFTIKDIEKNFIDNYVIGLDSIDRRIDEQLRIGNIEKVKDGYYKISKKGVRLMKLFRFIEEIFPVEEKRILY